MDLKKQAAEKAVELIRDQSLIGLGAGATMAFMVEYLKQQAEEGMEFNLVSSSEATRKLLVHQGFTVLEMAEVSRLDQYFDGCDQFDKNFNALKSGGGIHTHEKLLAVMAAEFILVGDESKYVYHFDNKYPLVLEIIPEALLYVQNQMQKLFDVANMAIRFDQERQSPIRTINGNLLLDIWFRKWDSLAKIHALTRNMVAVLESSLFYNLAQKAVIGTEDGARILIKSND